MWLWQLQDYVEEGLGQTGEKLIRPQISAVTQNLQLHRIAWHLLFITKCFIKMLLETKPCPAQIMSQGKRDSSPAPHHDIGATFATSQHSAVVHCSCSFCLFAFCHHSPKQIDQELCHVCAASHKNVTFDFLIGALGPALVNPGRSSSEKKREHFPSLLGRDFSH